MPAPNRGIKVELWLLLFSSLVFAPQPARADVVTDWNMTAISVLQAAGQPAAMQSRNIAMVHAAIYDAVNAIDRRHPVYAVDIKAKPGTSLEAAAAAAAYGVLTKLYWAQTAVFDVALEASLAAIPDDRAKADGIAVGNQVADKLMTLRKDDRSDASVSYALKSAPGAYQLTPPAFAPVVLPHWGGVTPFMLKSADQFQLSGPPAPNSVEFAKDMSEVKTLGAKHSSNRTRDQTDAARFWTASGIVTDNDVARQLSKQKGLSVVENARLFALLNMAGADAYISCWQAKYHYNHWRPVTAIRNADHAGNSEMKADPSWEPLLPVPAHPEYPAGHTCFAGATERVLHEFFGDKVSFSLTNPAVKVTRNYQSLSQLGKEVADARVWGGMHYRTAVVHGRELGHNIAGYGLKTHLRPVN